MLIPYALVTRHFTYLCSTTYCNTYSTCFVQMLGMFVVTVRCSFSVVRRGLNTQSSSKQFQTQWHILYKTVIVSAATAITIATTAVAVGVAAAVQYLNQYLQCITFHQKLPQYPADPANGSSTGVYKILQTLHIFKIHKHVVCLETCKFFIYGNTWLKPPHNRP